MIASMIFTNCSDKVDNSENIVINLNEIDTTSVINHGCPDIQFIPLENKRECMLSDVPALKATENGIYIYNSSPEPQVFLFGNDGQLLHQVGRLGHGRGEYQFIQDMSSNRKGDSVLVMTFDDYMLYDANGKYVSSSEIKENVRLENVEITSNGIASSRNYRGNEWQVVFLDKDFNHVSNAVSVNPACVVKNPPFVFNALQSCGTGLCYLDQYESVFYIFDGNNSLRKSYTLVSDNMITFDAKDDEKKDMVVYYVYTGERIIGEIIYNNEWCYFEIDTENDSFRFGGKERPTFLSLDYYDGYYYAVVSAAQMMNLTNEKMGFMNPVYPSLDYIRRAFAPYKENLDENDNYFVVKYK